MKVYKISRDGKHDIVILENGNQFKITRKIRIQASIGEGSEVCIEQLKKLDELSKIDSAYQDALYYLRYRPRTMFEVKNKLKHKGYSEKIISKTIEKLTEQRLLNDDEFVRLWIKNRIELKPRGKRLIYYELIQKGVDKSCIEKNLEELVTAEDEVEMAGRLLKKRFKTAPKHKKNQEKMINYLYRKGFSWNIIKKVLKHENLQH